MRSLARTITILAIAVGLNGLSGCKKKEEEKPAGDKAGEGGSATAQGGPNQADGQGRLRGQGAAARLGLEPVSVEEVVPLIPALTGATQLAEPKSVAGGRRVTVVQCLPSEDIELVKKEVEDKLTKLGFGSMRSSPNGKRDLVTISAEKAPMRVAATLRSGPYPDCPADQKKIKLLMSYFKRIPRPPRPDGATAPAGTPPAGTAPSGAAPPGAAPPAAPAQGSSGSAGGAAK